MAIASVSTFTLAGEQYLSSGLWIMAAFALMGFIAISLWAYLGVAIAQLLTTQTRKRNFNWIMGLMTASTLIFILAD
jgi:threonine/homoserine/homoserine lactone efflux protein